MFHSLYSLENGTTYKVENGVESLYLHGSGAHATAPAVDFGNTSFTIASWVKLQSPVNIPSPIYADWSGVIKFIFQAYEPPGKLLFGVFNNNGVYEPWLKAE